MKFKIYILFFLCFGFKNVFKAQIIYVGDSTSTNVIYNNISDTIIILTKTAPQDYYMDIDKDGIKDFQFHTDLSASPTHVLLSWRSIPLNGMEQVAPLNNSFVIDTLVPGTLIKESLNWKNTASIMGYSSNSVSSGVFKTKNNYFGFRKILTNDTVYGWFLVDYQIGIKIRAYAYVLNCSKSNSLTATLASTIICTSEKTTLNVAGALTYTWSSGQNTSSVVISPSVTTNYTVSGTTSNGCLLSSIITQSVDACIGIREYDYYGISIYPNPATNQFFVKNSGVFKIEKYILFSTEGKRVMVAEHVREEIDLRALDNGIYFLQIHTNQGILTRKVVVQH